MKRLNLLLTLFFVFGGLVATALSQDPGSVDSLVFGNPDGSAIEVFVDHEITIPVYLKCDKNVAFINLCLATENYFIIDHLAIETVDQASGWRTHVTSPVDSWPLTGQTSQALVGIADFAVPEVNYINTQGQWLQIAEFRLKTTHNLEAMGQTSYLHSGEDPVEGVTMLFDEFWTPIIPEISFSSLYFLDAVPPAIVSPSVDTLITVNSLYPFSFSVIAEDNDVEDITINAECDITGYTFNRLEGHPGYARYLFSWTPPQDCDSIIPIRFEAVDDHGLTDELNVNLNVEPITLAVSSDSTFPGFTFTIDVMLIQEGNNSHVGSFDLDLLWDSEAFTAEGIIWGDELDDWDLLQYLPNIHGDGSLGLVGMANIDSEWTLPLMHGEHLLARITFQSTFQDLQGFVIPFVLPASDLSFNVVSDSSGSMVYHPRLVPGHVAFIDHSSILVGDINLNGVPYEMGDLILFINHLSDPEQYPFNALQRYASDCNEDGIPETIADVIYMMNIITGGGPTTNAVVIAPDLQLNLNSAIAKVALLDDSSPIGGIFLQISHKGVQIANIKSSAKHELYYKDDGSILTAVVYPKTLANGLDSDILNFDIVSGNANDISIAQYDLSTIGGKLVKK